MKKMLRVIRKIIVGLLTGIGIVGIGLIINNRIFYAKYCAYDRTNDKPIKSEISEANEILEWLNQNGDQIFEGLDGNIDLILFNQAYEFLFSDVTYEGWQEIQTMDNGKKIYRRKAQNPQAFATKVGDTWAGSFDTYGYFNCALLEQIPMIIPPQLLVYDSIGYRSMVVHEMVHAYQGRCDNERVDEAEHLKNIDEQFNQNTAFNHSIEEEGKILEEALESKDNEKQLIQSFLNVRDERRKECGMTEEEIWREQEFEWLEGGARYGEYIASQGTRSIVSKNLGNISEKVKTRGDDRFYTLGMAQILLIKKMQIPNWQSKLLKEEYTPEKILREAL